jgi:hypothetical protein
MQMTNADFTINRYGERGFYINMSGGLNVACATKEVVDLIVLGAAAKGLSVYDTDREVFLTGDVGQLAGEPAE